MVTSLSQHPNLNDTAPDLKYQNIATTGESIASNMCVQRRLKLVFVARLNKLAIQNVHSEDSDQTARMRRLIWIFAGRSWTDVQIYSWLSLSRTRLSRIAAYLEVKILSLPKHENLTSKKHCGKEEKGAISPLFHNIFDMSLTARVQLHIDLLNVVDRIIFSSILKIWYVEVRILRSVSKSPLEFEITRVDYIFLHWCIIVVSDDFVNGEHRPWWDCADAQSNPGLHCAHIPEDMFSPGAVQLLQYLD